jgi:predicted nucleic acid-binding protein
VSFVLDTNVVSALRTPGKNPSVATWAQSVAPETLYIASLTVSELERGIRGKERVDPQQGVVLRQWFEHQVLPAFEGRILPFDEHAAKILGSYPVPESAPLDDALIASVAQSRSMTVVTRNVRHFAPLPVACFNPWD